MQITRVLSLFLALTALAAAGCSSDDKKVCSTSEESACTTAYTTCTATAAATADLAACQKCVDDYCACYSACGNTCDKEKLSGACK